MLGTNDVSYVLFSKALFLVQSLGGGRSYRGTDRTGANAA